MGLTEYFEGMKKPKGEKFGDPGKVFGGIAGDFQYASAQRRAQTEFRIKEAERKRKHDEQEAYRAIKGQAWMDNAKNRNKVMPFNLYKEAVPFRKKPEPMRYSVNIFGSSKRRK